VRLRYTPRSIADLAEIADYLVSRNPIGAGRVRTAILVTLQTIIDLPHAGRLQTTDAVRKVAVRRYPYLVYYHVDEDAGEIVVLTIQHSARRRAFSDA
jgi:plasmid stabilization system protein ParE